jgi:hypothetical protein
VFRLKQKAPEKENAQKQYERDNDDLDQAHGRYLKRAQRMLISCDKGE